MNDEAQMDVTRAVASALVIGGFLIHGMGGTLTMAAGALLAAFNVGRRFQIWHAQRKGSAFRGSANG